MALEADARRGEVVAGLFLAACGAGISVLAWQMPLGQFGSPGPGFAPFALGLVLAGLGVGCALRGWRKADGIPVVLGEPRVLVCIGALVACAALWTRLGFAPSSALFLTVLFRTLARSSWPKALLAGVLAAGATSVLFEEVLGVALPAGFLHF